MDWFFKYSLIRDVIEVSYRPTTAHSTTRACTTCIPQTLEHMAGSALVLVSWMNGGR